jgi:hypothetical protein
LDLCTVFRWLSNEVDFLPFHFLFFGASLAALNDLAVGAPLDPGLRIRSGVSPAAFCVFIRFRFA